MGSSLSNPAFGVTSNDWNSGVIFRVGWDGSLYAANANITGSITATSGRVGNWHLKTDGSLTTSSQSTGYTVNAVYFETNQMRYEYAIGGSQAHTFSSWLNIINAGNSHPNSQSDRNVKNSIQKFNDKCELLFDCLKPCIYKYNHGTSDRFHSGFIAQDVFDGIKNAGLTTKDFAAYIELDTEDQDGCKYMLRRDEFVALNTWQIQKLKQRINELENIINNIQKERQ